MRCGPSREWLALNHKREKIEGLLGMNPGRLPASSGHDLLPPGGGGGDNGNGSTLRALMLQLMSDFSIVSQEVSSLRSEVHSEINGVKNQQNLLLAAEQRASASREQLHDKVNSVTTGMAVMKQTVTRIAPLVDDLVVERHQRVGRRENMVEMGRVAYAAIAAIAGVLAFLFDLAFRYFTQHPSGK